METWLPVKGYEGYYEVSDSGNIRRIYRPEPYLDRKDYRIKYKGRNYTLCRDYNNVRSEMAAWGIPEIYYNLLTPALTDNGYLRVGLRVGPIRDSIMVHVLVAQAFLPSPLEGQNEVNHKDLNKLNNNDWNLEWMTHQENVAHYHENRTTKDTVHGNGRKIQ